MLLQPAVQQLRGRTVLSPPPTWPAKDPAATVVFGADFRVLTNGAPLDGFTADATGCSVLDRATFGTVAAVQLVGGADRTLALVTLAALWNQRSSAVQVRLPIQNAPAPYDGTGYPFPETGGDPTPSGAVPAQQGFSGIAGGPISGHRHLMPNPAGRLVHGDPADPGYSFVGISVAAVAAGAVVTALPFGPVVEPSWSWTPSLPIFAGPGGGLTQQAPASGVLQQVGVALSATSMLVQPLTPTLRA